VKNRKHFFGLTLVSIIVAGSALLGCSGEDPKTTVGMCYFYIGGDASPSIQGMFTFCTTPQESNPPCNNQTIGAQTNNNRYVTKQGQVATYDDQGTCESDLDAVSDNYSSTGTLSPGPKSNESRGGSNGGGTPAGCSTTQDALDAKCMKEPKDVYDNCTLECNPVCVYVDGCNCGIQGYCDSIEPKCLALKAIGCTCSWCP